MTKIQALFPVAVGACLAISCCHRAGAASKDAILAQAAKACRTNEMDWVEGLYSLNPMVRGSSLQNLKRVPDIAEICFPRLEELLADRFVWDPFRMASVGEEAAGVLRRIGGNKAFSLAVAATTNRNVVVRRNAVWAFPFQRNGRATSEAAPFLEKLLHDKDKTVRNRAAKSLSGMDMSLFGNDPERWCSWYENSGWQSPSPQDYAYFAVFLEDSRCGPKVYAPLDPEKRETYPYPCFHAIWAPRQFGRILSIEKIENGKVVWSKSYGPGQSLPEREVFY
ncbi:MAG: HEAT repeat domain-containing protein [Kiritimatiellae bacterium]|nr:HEAT repeat domain-containing protein [Kiritimatiellia bacterium]